jgi:hypothetical protein
MAEIDPFAASDELYSVVIVGSMNPAIHHPRWYLAAGLLSEGEVTEAESHGRGAVEEEQDAGSSALWCTENYSQFTAGAFRVVCFQQNWTIMTIDRASFERARDVCAGVFKTLHHTPISAYGFNFAFHEETGAESVGRILAEKMPIEVSERGPNDFARFHYHSRRNGDEVTIALEPSMKGPKKLFVGINTSHQIKETGLFDLSPMLLSDFAKDCRESEELAKRITSQFK